MSHTHHGLRITVSAMSLPPDDAGEAAEDLLGRWSAHHRGGGDVDADARDRSRPEAPRHAARHAARPSSGPAWTPDQVEASREVVEALGIAPAEAEDAADVGPDDQPAARERAVAPPQPGASTDVVFPPRRGWRRLLGLVLLVLLVATVLAGAWAYEERTTLALGIAGTLLVATLAVYGVRASAVPTKMRIHAGQLEVVRGRERDVFDLSSRFTRIEEIGTPGRPGWKVRLGRFGRDPLVIDRSMVNPHAFSEALDRHRRSSDD